MAAFRFQEKERLPAVCGAVGGVWALQTGLLWVCFLQSRAGKVAVQVTIHSRLHENIICGKQAVNSNVVELNLCIIMLRDWKT